MISWDEDKKALVLNKRGIDFADLEKLLYSPYVEDQKNDDPEQYRIVGKVGERYLTFIVEYEEDELGELIWVVTAWESTQEEREDYEQEIGA
jgi:uncharacterized DUF497 family protein